MNRNLFNGIEREDELALTLDFAFFRAFNPAIGRWLQIDPKATEKESPYVGFANNPIKFSDVLGDTVKYEGLDRDVQKMKNNDQELKKTRMGRRILKKLEKSKNVHHTRGVPKGGTEEDGREARKAEIERYKDGKISETEFHEYLTAGAVTFSESDIEYFRGEGYDAKDSDGTGTGSTMLWGDHSEDLAGGLDIFAHERIHQYDADRGKISKKTKSSRRSVDEIRTQRRTYRMMKQYQRKTGNEVRLRRNYYN